MIVYKYYVIYVEVPTGYPGVEIFESPMIDKNEILELIKHVRSYAILDILEAN